MRLIFKVLIFLLVTIPFHASAATACLKGQGPDGVAIEIVPCSGYDCNLQGKTLFDRDGLRQTSQWSLNGAQPSLNFTYTVELGSKVLSPIIGIGYKANQGPVSFGAGSGRTPLSPGDHFVRATVALSSGYPTCSDTVTFKVEKTNVLGQIESVNPDGLISGVACIKGTTTNRIMADTTVDIGISSMKLGSVSAKNSRPYSGLASQCGASAGYSLQLSERQRADYCDQRLYASIAGPGGYGPSTGLIGSGDYLIPCALRPLVDEIIFDKKVSVSAIGTNFKSSTKADIYDANGALWATVPITYYNEKKITFQLPGEVPPSKCNLNSSCQITVRFINPDGAAQGIYSSGAITLSSKTPVIGSYTVDISGPTAIKVTGSNFQANSTVELMDTNGNLWGSTPSYTFNNSTSISFKLPANTPPSGCNLSGSCSIKAKITNPYQFAGQTHSMSTTFSITLPRLYKPSLSFFAGNPTQVASNAPHVITFNLSTTDQDGIATQATLSAGGGGTVELIDTFGATYDPHVRVFQYKVSYFFNQLPRTVNWSATVTDNQGNISSGTYVTTYNVAPPSSSSSSSSSPIVDTDVPNKLLFLTGPYGNYIEPGCVWQTVTNAKKRVFLCGSSPVAEWTWTGSSMYSNCTITAYPGYKHYYGCPTAIKLEQIL